MSPRQRAAPRLVVATAALLVVVALALPHAALAQALPGDVGNGVVTLDAWDWVNLALRLVAVVAVIVAAFWGMRWYQRRLLSGFGTSRSLQVLETRALGPNRSLQLVRVGRRAVLVGVTAERINQLLEIDDPEEVERLAQAAAAQEPGPSLNRLAGSISRVAAVARTTRAPRRLAPRDGATIAPALDQSGPATQQLQASTAYRGARIAELQRAIEDARRGTSFERVP